MQVKWGAPFGNTRAEKNEDKYLSMFTWAKDDAIPVGEQRKDLYEQIMWVRDCVRQLTPTDPDVHT